jgi:hypothetical protein
MKRPIRRWVRAGLLGLGAVVPSVVLGGGGVARAADQTTAPTLPEVKYDIETGAFDSVLPHLS